MLHIAICNQSCFLTDQNARESYEKFMDWLELVYQEAELPGGGLENALTRHRKVKGCYHGRRGPRIC